MNNSLVNTEYFLTFTRTSIIHTYQPPKLSLTIIIVNQGTIILFLRQDRGVQAYLMLHYSSSRPAHNNFP